MPTFGYYMADLSRTKNASHGIINYSLGLLSAITRLLESNERLVVFGSDAIRAEFDTLLSSDAQMEWHTTSPLTTTVRRLVGDHIKSLSWARRAGVDVLHFPKGFIPIWHPSSLGIVATIHDDIPIRYSSGYFGEENASRSARYFSMQIRHSLRKANVVLAVSEFTRHRLESLGLHDPASVIVTYEGVLDLVESHELIWPKKRQLLIMASVHPHKRTEETIDLALRYLEGRPGDLTLRVLGGLPQDLDRRLAGNPLVDRESKLFSSSDLIDVVAESAALIFGSSYEGFGLPPLEAALLHTPVVYRDCPAVNEVMRGTHHPFDAGSYDSFAAAVDAALDATESELAAAAQTLADRFDWARIGERTLDVYRSLVR